MMSFITTVAFGISNEKREFARELMPSLKKLVPLHKRMETPRRGEWLAEHPEEGQTFKEYLNCNPVLPTKTRDKIYLLPIGKLEGRYNKLVSDTSTYLRMFYNLETKLLKSISPSLIPKKARRENSYGTQLLSTYILNDILVPRLPDDAACIIALSKYDLWPGKDWNFVFGQANTRKRVGVWSLKRFGVDDKNVDYKTVLKRTVKTAAHEIGHMFTMRHCKAFECLMNGSNSLYESEGRPLYMCPHCLGKLMLLTNRNLKMHLQFMQMHTKTLKFETTSDFYKRSLNLLFPEKAVPSSL